MLYTYYKLDDGRVWDIEKACFVSAVPEDAVCKRPIGEDGAAADEEGLVFCLRALGYKLGELKTDADYAADARAERDRLLSATDFLVMPDYPLDEERRNAVLAYRQALRDVPEQTGFPRQIDWPVKP